MGESQHRVSTHSLNTCSNERGAATVAVPFAQINPRILSKALNENVHASLVTNTPEKFLLCTRLYVGKGIDARLN